MPSKDPFRPSDRHTCCPKCADVLYWNLENGLAGQVCTGCGYTFTGRERGVYGIKSVRRDTCPRRYVISFAPKLKAQLDVLLKRAVYRAFPGEWWVFNTNPLATTGRVLKVHEETASGTLESLFGIRIFDHEVELTLISSKPVSP